MQADRMKPLAQWLEPFRSLPLILLSLFMMVGAVDVLLAVQPAMLQGLRGGWQGWTVSQGISAPWASLLAATVSVAGIAIGAAILAGFLRVVQSEPFAWLAPVFVGACSLTIGRMTLVLPLPVSISVFATGSSLLFLGGASLIRTRESVRVGAGLFLLIMPLLALGAGYAQSTGEIAQHFAAHSGLLWLVLASAAAGAGLIAFACSQRASTQPLDSDEISEQLFETLERLSFSETRANEAEDQLAEMRRASAAFSLPSADFRASRLRLQRGEWQLWAALAFVLGCGASLYIASYLPLRMRLAAELTRNREQSAQQVLSAAALRAHFDAERAALIQQLTAARAAVVAPVPAADSTLVPSVGASVPVEAVPEASAEKSASGSKTQHHAWTSHRGAAHAASRTHAHRGAGEPSATDAAPAEITSEPAAPAKPAAKHDRGISSSSNDPLEGLDGM